MNRNKEKIKKESALKKYIKEMKKTSRGRAILKLIGWGIFFFILFIFCVIASFMPNPVVNENNKPNDKEQVEIKNEPEENLTEVNINVLIEDFLNSDFDYKYVININEVLTIFNGKKTGNEYVGYKESNNTIIKYKTDETGTYQIINNQEIIIPLYDGLNANYLDLNLLKTALKNIIFTKDTTCDCIDPVYIATFNNDIFTIDTLRVEDKYKIDRIEIKNASYRYYVTFNY